MSREELERFLTDKGRKDVARLFAEAAGESDDFDVTEVLSRNLSEEKPPMRVSITLDFEIPSGTIESGTVGLQAFTEDILRSPQTADHVTGLLRDAILGELDAPLTSMEPQESDSE